MELASRIRWIAVIAGGLLFLVLIGWALFAIAQSIFDSGSSNNISEVDSSQQITVETANAAFYSVDGPVVANSEHRSYTIEVNQNTVTMTVYSGYGANVIDQKSYLNTAESYETFLSALFNLDVTSRQRITDMSDDFAERGVCASGRRFIFELDNDLRRWSTSCSRDQGTAGFPMNNVASLFQNQVPDYRDLVSGTGL